MPKLNLTVSDTTPAALAEMAQAVGAIRHGRATSSAMADVLASAWRHNPTAAALLFAQLAILANEGDLHPEGWAGHTATAVRIIATDDETIAAIRRLIEQ